MFEIEYHLKNSEGRSFIVYQDSLGNPTVGWGHHDPNFIVGAQYTLSQIQAFFYQDLKIAKQDYNKLELQLDSVREGIVTMILFQLGYPTFVKFKKTIQALKDHDFAEAARQLGVGSSDTVPSMYRTQTTKRVHRYMAGLLTGIYL